MKKAFLIVALLFSRDAISASYYVTTSGSGTTCSVGTPCSSIVTGVSKLTGAGDVLNIATGTYTESSSATISASGTSGNRIRIVGAGSSSTIWQRSGSTLSQDGGAINATDKSYIEITGIRFKNITTHSTISHLGNTTAATDWYIHDNYFEGNGNQGTQPCAKTGAIAGRCGSTNGSRIIYLFGPVALDGTQVNVSNNTWDGNYGWNFQGSVGNSTFNTNTVTNQHSTKEGSANGFQYGFRWLTHFGSSCVGCGNNTVSGNDLGVTEKDSYVTGSDCGPAQTATCKWVGAAIKGDTGASNNTISGNIIHDSNVSEASNTNLDAIFFEASCNSNNILNNVIYNIGGSAIKLGSVNQNNAANNIIDGNSLYNCECGVALIRATATVVKNNIDHRGTFSDNGAFIIRTDLSGGSHTFKNNLIYDTSSATTNWSGTTSTVSACSTANVSYASWQSTYSETNSIGPSSDPMFISSSDLHLQGGSPAINAGDLGQDIGAYPLVNPPPTATISLTSPNGGESLFSGQIATITWVTNQTGNCIIEAARDGTNYSETIVASVACSAQSYTWTVTPPGRVSTAKFRITSISDGAVLDVSDAAFNIRGKYVSVLP